MTTPAEEWEQCARRAAEDLRRRLIQLLESTPRGKLIWTTVGQLDHDIAHAPAILLEDRVQLQQELQQCKWDLRRRQTERESAARERFAALTDALDLAAEGLQESIHSSQLQDVHADLTLLREQLDNARSILNRGQRQQLWDRWQTLNTNTWQSMQESKQARLTELAAYLDAAQEHLAARRPQDAKASIKQFHAAAQAVGATRGPLEELRVQARRLWDESTELGAEKHRNHVQWLQNKIRQAEREKQQLSAQHKRAAGLLQALQDQMGEQTTAVGAALLRGQLAARQRDVRDAHVRLRRAEREIEDLRSALGEA